MAKPSSNSGKYFSFGPFVHHANQAWNGGGGQGVQGSNGEGAGQLCRVVCMSLKCEREPPPAPAALDSGYNSDFPKLEFPIVFRPIYNI